MKIGIYVNLFRDENAVMSGKLARLLDEHGIEYAVADNAAQYFPQGKTLPLAQLLKESDVMAAFGGDGTMLEVIRLCAPHDIPVFGINTGKIGFLTEGDQDALHEVVDALQSKNFYIESRSMLQAEWDDGNVEYAVNEALLGSSDNCRVCTIGVHIDDAKADSVRCDGVIVSTPTGSTAYSLACNGPILSPTVKAFIVNAVCPHSLHSTPIVIDDDSVVTLTADNENMRLMLDGKIVAAFENGAKVVVRKSAVSARLVRIFRQNFYEKLYKKLSFWGD